MHCTLSRSPPTPGRAIKAHEGTRPGVGCRRPSCLGVNGVTRPGWFNIIVVGIASTVYIGFAVYCLIAEVPGAL